MDKNKYAESPAMLFKTPQDLSPCHDHVGNITNRAKYSLSPPIWGTYIVSVECLFLSFWIFVWRLLLFSESFTLKGGQRKCYVN